MLTDEFLPLLCFLTQILAFSDQLILAKRIPNAEKDPFSMKGLLDKIVGAQFGRLHCCLDCSMTGYHDDLWRVRLFLDLSKDFQAIHAWKFDIQKD
ncbi:MAG: hypothetical protein WA915_03785 [Candidatus Aminicenantaceae bacterium]